MDYDNVSEARCTMGMEMSVSGLQIMEMTGWISDFLCCLKNYRVLSPTD